MKTERVHKKKKASIMLKGHKDRKIQLFMLRRKLLAFQVAYGVPTIEQ